MTEVEVLSGQTDENFRPKRGKRRIHTLLTFVRARPDAALGAVSGLGAGTEVSSNMWHNPALLDIIVNTTAATVSTAGLVGFLSLLLLSRRSQDGMYGEMRRRDQRAREAFEGLRRR